MKLLVTGGAGFIGSAFVRYVLTHCPDMSIVNLDKLTYAGNLDNLASVADSPRYRFVHGDICDDKLVAATLAEERVDAIVHFAAESHVDRSILSPDQAIQTNVRGTATLLDASRQARIAGFLLISTDEVYGDIDEPLDADESFPLRPSSPYAASKAAADLLALSYVRTFKMPILITRASNNYGPYQFPEKLIPLMIANAMEGQPLPVYGDGLQVRDWLYVDDHCRAVLAVLRKGREGEVYNVAGTQHLPNIEVIKRVIEIVGASELPSSSGSRIDQATTGATLCVGAKIARETGFVPERGFNDGLMQTVTWYRKNVAWTSRVRSGAYREYYRENYAWRGDA